MSLKKLEVIISETPYLSSHSTVVEWLGTTFEWSC